MRSQSAEKWRFDFGLDRTGPPVFFKSIEEIDQVSPRHPQAHAMRRALEYMDLDGILCFDSNPIAYFRHDAAFYSPGLAYGGMIGYVIDGDVPRAVRAVSKWVDRERSALLLPAGTGLDASTVTPSGDVKETLHDRHTGRLTVQHIFLGVC